jgi:hypothetical protein
MRFQATEPRSILAILTLSVLTLPAMAAALAQDAAPATAEETAASADTAETKGPRAEVPEPVKDFGKVPEGQRLKHDYEIRNTGDEDLEITRVAPACGCTVADYDKVIKPGETGKIHAEVNTTMLGERNKRYISVYTNDPERPMIRLVFDAIVVPQLEIHPGYARYRVVHGEEEPGILKQWVYAVDGSDFKVTGVDSPLPYLHVSYHKATEDELHPEVSERAPESPQWIVQLDLDYNAAPVGAIAQEVVVHTDHPIQKELLIPVSGFVRPAMWATPHEINLGKIAAGKPVRFSVVVKNFLTEPMEITGVDFDGEEVESSVSPIQDGREYTVWITVEPETTKGAMFGKVRIHTSHPKNPVVEVPLQAMVM